MTKKTFYVSTAIDYASGNPHIGHVYEKIGADVLARWKRDLGYSVFFLTGTDEHGLKVFEKARGENVSVEEYVSRISDKFKRLKEDFSLSFDYFIRTTDVDHKVFVQKMLQKSFDNGDIYKAEYEGRYCVGCERYYRESELAEDKKTCKIHKKETIIMKEENYFFRLSNYKDRLLKFYDENPDFILPKSKRNEVLNRVKEGLEDISISRRKESLSWGVEFPFDSNHVTYVWFDALFNYLSATRNTKRDKFWPANLHVIGHDISWFHIVYWPAFLMSVEEELPKSVFSHGMILDKEGHKMSKSLGNVIDPYSVAAEFGVDEFRYYLLSLGAFGDDLRFSYESFAEKINNDLNNDLGNLVSRVHSMTQRYFDGCVPGVSEFSELEVELFERINIFEGFCKEMGSLRFNLAIDLLWRAIREVNAYINRTCPWKIEDKQRLGTVIATLVASIRLLTSYLNCIMPNKVLMIRRQMNFDSRINFEIEFLQRGHKISEKENLFQKVKLDSPKEVLEIKDSKRRGFGLLGLRVGRILSVDTHPSAERLYIEKIDIGEDKPRNIVSGLRGHYEKSELLGKMVVVVSNLKPAKIRGEISEGMILACENEEGVVGLISSEAKIGSVLKCGDVLADNSEKIDVDEFFEIKLEARGDKIFYENKEILVDGRSLFSEKGLFGRIR